MKIINPYTEILTPLDGQAILQHIELCGRVCYKSEDKITDTSAAKFVAGIIKRGHEAVLEHFDITVKFVCDRGVSHEIVRHRMASYCQESTRYCNYSKDVFGSEITVIRPSFLTEGTPGWQYEERGWITLHGLENVNAMYKEYHALGGNGTVTALVNTIHELEVRDDKRPASQA